MITEEQREEERFFKEFRTKTYRMYLRSEKWQAIRLEALRYYFHRCCICGARKNLQIHHINYEHLFKETMEDLTVLCGACHKRNSRTTRKT